MNEPNIPRQGGSRELSQVALFPQTVCAAFLWGALSLTAFGQATVGLVGGITRDSSSGKPVAEVQVTAHNLNKGTDRYTVSNADGVFTFTNVEPGRPLYVMQSPVRVFEQIGLSWKEVPSRDPDGQGARVIKLADAYTFQSIFEPNLAEWTDLIPGYMHIRFEANSLISERSEPDDDIIDRTDRYYVYLKPHGADDNAIRKRMNYKGDPPVYMPMPPH